ncbi:hypothetical protein HDU97_009193 [Phlyctochytrium planicorne]|nr:hypothetical protein HDU97_009193 [Phlyctochytrium planicorne]
MTGFKHVIVITGAGKGIGKAVACELANLFKGGETAIALVDKGHKKEMDEEASKLSKHGFQVETYDTDLAVDSSAKKLISAVVDKFGKITGLVNNAAVCHCGDIDKVTEEDYHRVFDVNVKSVICLIAASIPHMAECSSIVNISAALTHCPYNNHSLYAASKGAVEALTRALAVEVASKKIRVNTVSPGFTDTDMLEDESCDLAKRVTPMGRIGKVEDIAPVIGFYLCEKSAWVTGQNVIASGGFGHAM